MKHYAFLALFMLMFLSVINSENVLIPASVNLKGIINSEGEQALDGYYNSIIPVGTDKIFAQSVLNGSYSFYDGKKAVLEGIDFFQAASYENIVEWPILVKRNGKLSYMDSSGVLVNNAVFTEGTTFFSGYALVNLNGKNSFINTKCTAVLEIPKYDSIFVPNDPGEVWALLSGDQITVYGAKLEILCKVPVKDIRSGFKTMDILGTSKNALVLGLSVAEDEIDYQATYVINYSGKVTKTESGSLELFNGNIYKYELKGLYGLIDSEGNIVMKPSYKIIGACTNGFAKVAVITPDKKRAWGFIDGKGNLVVPTIYSGVDKYSEGLCSFKDSNLKWGYIDTAGKVIIEAQFTSAEPFIDGKALIQDDTGYHWINKSGKKIINSMYTQIYSTTGFYGKRALVRDFVDKGREWIWFVINDNGEYTKKIIKKDVYEYSKFDSFGYMQYSVQKIGLINELGAFVVPAKYSQIGLPSDGWYAVDINDGYNEHAEFYLNAKGEEALRLKEGYGGSFKEGFAKITNGKNEYIIDKNGTRYDTTFRNTFMNGYAFVNDPKNGANIVDKKFNVIGSVYNIVYPIFDSSGFSSLYKDGRFGTMQEGYIIFERKFSYSMGTNGIIRFEEYFTEDGKTFPCYGYGTVRDSVCWFDYDNATDFYDNVAVVRKYKGSSFALINQDLQIIASSIQWEDYMNFYNSNNAGLYVFRNKNSKQAGVFNKSGVLLYKIDVDPSENNCVVVGKDLLFTLGSDRLLTAYSKYDGNVVFKDKRWTWDAYSFFLNSFRNINDYSIVGYQGFDNYSILDPSGKILYNR